MKISDCPFCASPAEAENTITEYVIRCTGCRATLTRKHEPRNDRVATCRAVNAWNRRTSQSGEPDTRVFVDRFDGLGEYEVLNTQRSDEFLAHLATKGNVRIEKR